MPALPNVPAVLRVVLSHVRSEDINAINRFYLEYTGTAPTNAELVTFAGAIGTAWGAHLQTFAHPNVSLHTVDVEDLTSPTSAVGHAEPDLDGTNTPGFPLPAAASVVLQQRIARRYRGGHSRQYLPYLIAESLSDDQRWDPTTLANLLTAYKAFETAIEGDVWAGGGTLHRVNVSYFQGFTPHTYPSGRTRDIPNLRATPIVDQVTSLTMNPKVGSQRRRNLQGS